MTIHSVEAMLTEAALTVSGVTWVWKAVILDLIATFEDIKLRRIEARKAAARKDVHSVHPAKEVE